MSEERSRAAHLVEDLSVLSRRGVLSAAERLTLAEELEASATLATAHQLGLDFDHVAAVRPGDDALIAEVAARTVTRGHPARFARVRLRVLLLAATLALAGTAAAWWQHSRAAPPVSLAAAGQASTRAAPVAPHDSPSTAGPATSAAFVSPPAPVSAAPTVQAPSLRANELTGRPSESAELLFREANAARRAGDKAAARALYLRLQREFATSDEAYLAHVSLGNLLLSMGRPSEAEQQFASYLRARSVLAQEALVGRAQSLAALGRSGEEQAVWEGLLRDYPGSVYAGRAKQRLAELTRSP
jgi:TolA-binding protein